MNKETLNKIKYLAGMAAHLPADVTLEDEDAALKALHGELAADTVLELIALAERTTSPVSREQDPLHASLDSLAMALWRSHYRNTAPEFELLPDAAGVLSQIDNMVSGLRRADPVSQMTAHLAAIEEALKVMRDNGLSECYAYDEAVEALAAMKATPANRQDNEGEKA